MRQRLAVCSGHMCANPGAAGAGAAGASDPVEVDLDGPGAAVAAVLVDIVSLTAPAVRLLRLAPLSAAASGCADWTASGVCKLLLQVPRGPEPSVFPHHPPSSLPPLFLHTLTPCCPNPSTGRIPSFILHASQRVHAHASLLGFLVSVQLLLLHVAAFAVDQELTSWACLVHCNK